MPLAKVEPTIDKPSHREVKQKYTFYLAGPMAGYPDHNFPAFKQAAEFLRQYGYTVYSPHEMVPAVKDPEPRDYVWHDLAEMIDKCDAIILLDGWVHSDGAWHELTLARTLNWPVFYFDSDYTIINMNGKAVV